MIPGYEFFSILDIRPTVPEQLIMRSFSLTANLFNSSNLFLSIKNLNSLEFLIAFDCSYTANSPESSISFLNNEEPKGPLI